MENLTTVSTNAAFYKDSYQVLSLGMRLLAPLFPRALVERRLARCAVTLETMPLIMKQSLFEKTVISEARKRSAHCDCDAAIVFRLNS